ncbi:MAG: hypothetical protein U0441_02660 [Polyangiaceae bacterium]
MTASNRRILVVDDNRDIHDDFRKLLGRVAGGFDLDAMAAELFDLPVPRAETPTFELSFASQGHEGFEMVASGAAVGMPYALVFMDMRMPPGWDGLETLERIWSVDPAIQAVICTAYSDYSWEQIQERLGPTDRLLVLKKPFDSLEVRQLALAMTEKWNDHRAREQTEAHLRNLLREIEARAGVGDKAVSLRFTDDVTQESRVTLADELLPAVPVADGVLAVPLVGAHDAARLERVAAALVSAVLSRGTRVMVLDGSCLTPADEEVRLGVAMAVQAVEALACQVVLTSMPFAPFDSDSVDGPFWEPDIDRGIAKAIALADRSSGAS